MSLDTPNDVLIAPTVMRAPESVRNATKDIILDLVRGQEDALNSGIYMDDETVAFKISRLDMLQRALEKK